MLVSMYPYYGNLYQIPSQQPSFSWVQRMLAVKDSSPIKTDRLCTVAVVYQRRMNPKPPDSWKLRLGHRNLEPRNRDS